MRERERAATLLEMACKAVGVHGRPGSESVVTHVLEPGVEELDDLANRLERHEVRTRELLAEQNRHEAEKLATLANWNEELVAMRYQLFAIVARFRFASELTAGPLLEELGYGTRGRAGE